jgi:hypothetical protein
MIKLAYFIHFKIRSRVIFLDELEVLVEGNASTVVSIDLIKIPANHFFSDGDVQRLKRIFHQSFEFRNVNELIFFVLGNNSSRAKEMAELIYNTSTYSSKVILPSPFSSILEKCQSS